LPKTGEYPWRVQEGARAEESDPPGGVVQLIVTDAPGRHRREERVGGEHMNAETETAIQNLSNAFADTADTMKRIANSLVNIELHLQAMRPSGVQTVRGPTR
jgi:uncharacterized coiled-coil protein SlyX